MFPNPACSRTQRRDAGLCQNTWWLLSKWASKKFHDKRPPSWPESTLQVSQWSHLGAISLPRLSCAVNCLWDITAPNTWRKKLVKGNLPSPLRYLMWASLVFMPPYSMCNHQYSHGWRHSIQGLLSLCSRMGVEGLDQNLPGRKPWRPISGSNKGLMTQCLKWLQPNWAWSHPFL